MLQAYVERDLTAADLVAEGFDPGSWSTGSCGSSTAPSTSAARCRRASGSPPRRSERTGACPSPTATAPRLSRSPVVVDAPGAPGGSAGYRPAGAGGGRLLLGRAPDLRADRGVGLRPRRRRPAAADPRPPRPSWRPNDGSGVRRAGTTGRWRAAGPTGYRCGRGSTAPPWWSRGPARAGALDALASEADLGAGMTALVRTLLPRLSATYLAHQREAAAVREAPVMEVLAGARRLLAGEIRAGRALVEEFGVAPERGARLGELFERAFEQSSISPAVRPS